MILIVFSTKTVELVKQSVFVICHLTTSIQFAILFEKPIRLVTNDEIDKTIYGKHIELMAKEIGQKKINIQDPFERSESDEIKFEMRKDYIKKYIKYGGPEKGTVWEIILI